MALWLLCFYVAVEYLRLHQAYPALDILPWATVAIAACFLATVLPGSFGRRFYPMDFLVGAFFLWLIFSSTVGWSANNFWADWPGWSTWIVLYILVSLIPVTRVRFLLFWLALMVINLKMSQHGALSWASRGFSFAGWGVTGSPGWFQNSGEFAMEMTFFLGTSWCFLWALKPFIGKRKLWILLAVLPGTAVASIAASSSRGGQLAAVGVILAILLLKGVRWKPIVWGAALLVTGWLILPDAQKERFSSMGSDGTSVQRLTYWRHARQIARENPILGIGYGNWGAYFTARNGVAPEVEIHNTSLELAVETGLPGAALFFSMVAYSFLANVRTRRRARKMTEWGRVFVGFANGLDAGMVGLLIASQFMSVLFYPMFWMSFALTTALAETARRAERSLHRPTPVSKPRLELRPTGAIQGQGVVAEGWLKSV